MSDPKPTPDKEPVSEDQITDLDPGQGAGEETEDERTDDVSNAATGQ